MHVSPFIVLVLPSSLLVSEQPRGYNLYLLKIDIFIKWKGILGQFQYHLLTTTDTIKCKIVVQIFFKRSQAYPAWSMVGLQVFFTSAVRMRV